MNLSMPELALRLGITESQLRRAIATGVIAPERVGRVRLVKLSDLPVIRAAMQRSGLLAPSLAIHDAPMLPGVRC